MVNPNTFLGPNDVRNLVMGPDKHGNLRPGLPSEETISLCPDKAMAEFEVLSNLLIRWLCEHVHPHHTIIITPTSAELLSGERSLGRVTEYVKD